MLRNFWQSFMVLGSSRSNRARRRNAHPANRAFSLEVLEVRQMLAAATLDPTFGVGGRVIRDHGGIDETGNAVALQADGKIVMVGGPEFGSGETVLTRYNANGSLDDGGPLDSTPADGFGTNGNGRITSVFGPGKAVQRCADVAIQADGKIVLIGSAKTFDGAGSNFDFALARYNTDGTLDTSFGGGFVFTDFGSPEDEAIGVAIQTDGKIVVVGYTSPPNDDGFFGADNRFAMARYNQDGSLDADFTGGAFGDAGFYDGRVITNFSGSEVPIDFAVDVAIQADDKIVVVGTTFNLTTARSDFAVARYNSDGSLDPDFGDHLDGKVTADFGGHDEVKNVAIQADGKIVVGGQSDDRYLALARYDVDGNLDLSFSYDGKIKSNVDGDSVRALAIQANGKIVVGCKDDDFDDPNFILLRYDSFGKLDTTFDSDGKAVTDFGGRADSLFDVVIQPDGKILAVGGSSAAGQSDFAVARYLGDAPDIVVTGSDAGVPNVVHIYNAITGEELLPAIVPYAPTFTGGVRVSTGDVNGDGVLDVITVPGLGSGTNGMTESRVKVYDGITHTILPGAIGNILVDVTTIKVGLFVAAADVNGDGRADIITGSNSGTNERVRVFNGLDASLLFQTTPYGTSFSGGVRVAAGDVNGDGKADIIVAPGASTGLAQSIKVYDGATHRQLLRTLGSFVPFERTFLGGVYVAAGDINGDGRADIIVGAGTGASRVKVFSGKDRSVLASFTAFDPTFNKGVRVAVADVNGDGRDDIITGAGSTALTGAGQGPLVSLFDSRTLETIDSFFVDDADTTHGIFVAGSPHRRR